VSALARLAKPELVTLVREYLLAGHLIDRSAMPHVIGELGVEAMTHVAIEEWRAASPVYTRRMQRLLGFEGDDVATIFKGMQLDIGAPPQFMDFRFQVDSATRGEFWLDSCGALMDVEPMGNELVVAMCHHIEDPTFDATACATNPRARMLPIHRPPRSPVDRHPHCHWTVDIDPGADPLAEPEGAVRAATTRAARLPVRTPADRAGTEGSGQTDYAGSLQADLDLAGFSTATLVDLAEEVALQGHLLALSFLAAVTDRWGAEVATSLGVRQLTGIAGLTAERLRRALGFGRDLGDLAAVLDLHPLLQPRAYVPALVELGADGRSVVLRIDDGEALHEEVAPSWPALLDRSSAPLDAIAQAVDPRARVVRGAAPSGDGTEAPLAWEIAVDLDAEPAPELAEVTLTRFSTGADFEFSAR
jgi:hypothetical protein